MTKSNRGREPARAHFPNLKEHNLDKIIMAVEVGGSKMRVSTRREDETAWVKQEFAATEGASAPGKQFTLPTIAAVKEGEICYGLDAESRLLTDHGWTSFEHLKLALFDRSRVTHNKQTMEDQAEKAKGMGLDIKTLAVGFLSHALRKVRVSRGSVESVAVNIVDIWEASVAQTLLLEIQGIFPSAHVQGAGETLCTILGVVRPEHLSSGDEARIYTFDFGHTTTCAAFADISSDTLLVQDPEIFEIGSGEIDKRIAESMRRINCRQGLHLEDGVREHCNFISVHGKADVRRPLQRRRGFTDQDWTEVEESKLDGDRFANTSRIDFVIDYLCRKEAEGQGHARMQPVILMTGGASQSATLYECMMERLENKALEPNIVWDASTETAVEKGLQFIADHPVVVKLERAPVSIFIRDHGTGQSIDDEGAIRLLSKNQDLSGVKARAGERDPQLPILYDLEVIGSEGEEREQPWTFDFSVFCTPQGRGDNEVVSPPQTKTKKRKRTKAKSDFVRASTAEGNLTVLGNFTKALRIKNTGNHVSHVYVYSELSRLSLRLFAVYVEDGQVIPELDHAKFSDVIRNDKLRPSWRSHKQKKICIDIIGQVFRTEFFGAPLSLHQLHSNPRPLLSSNSEQLNTVLTANPHGEGPYGEDSDTQTGTGNIDRVVVLDSDDEL